MAHKRDPQSGYMVVDRDYNTLVSVTFRIPRSMHTRLKRMAKQTNAPMNTLAEEAIEEYLLKLEGGYR